MGDLELDLSGALSLAGSIFNELAAVAVTAIGLGLGMILVSIITTYIRFKR